MVGDDKCRESQDCPSIKLWFGFFLFPFPEVVRFLFFHCGFFSFFSFPVTLPGTYAGRSALTRGKPIFP